MPANFGKTHLTILLWAISVRENVRNNSKKRKKSCFLDFEKNEKT